MLIIISLCAKGVHSMYTFLRSYKVRMAAEKGRGIVIKKCMMKLHVHVDIIVGTKVGL